MYIVEACFCDVCSVDLTCDIPRCFQIRKEETCWCCYTKGKCGLVRAANSLCYAGRPTDRPIARHKVVGSDHDVLLAAVAVLLLRRPVRVSVHQRRAAPRRTRTVRPPSALLEFCERATAQVPCACSCLPFCLCCPKPACCTTLADYIPASMNNREIPVDPRNLTICAACCCEIVSCYCKVPDCLGCASSAICYCCCHAETVCKLTGEVYCCCKATEVCCCVDYRCALPCSSDWPMMCTILPGLLIYPCDKVGCCVKMAAFDDVNLAVPTFELVDLQPAPALPPGGRLVTVQVPAGTAPGTTISVPVSDPNGQTLTVQAQVPQVLGPDNTMQVQV
mmetsp:Transcript_24134/g.77858  ORF Transcript_24134/g.77858 Transcript_24134/m.77858 type:complete len:335 (+) Transcript_24134:246-1250(+)